MAGTIRYALLVIPSIRGISNKILRSRSVGTGNALDDKAPIDDEVGTGRLSIERHSSENGNHKAP